MPFLSLKLHFLVVLGKILVIIIESLSPKIVVYSNEVKKELVSANRL